MHPAPPGTWKGLVFAIITISINDDGYISGLVHDIHDIFYQELTLKMKSC